LDARFRDHHGFLVAQVLAHVDYLEEAIAAVGERIDAAIAPFQAAVELLVAIPGVQRRTAEVVVAEIGIDMSHFPTSRHLSSWAGLSPGNNESAGKRKHGRTTKGSPWLRTALVEAALGATRPHGYLRAKYWRVRGRRGHQPEPPSAAGRRSGKPRIVSPRACQLWPWKVPRPPPRQRRPRSALDG